MARPGQFVPEYIVTANDMNALPGGVLGYAEVTANQGSITTEVDLTGLSVTVDVLANRRIRITGHAQMATDTAAAVGDMDIHQDGVRVGRAGRHRFAASNSVTVFSGSVVVVPSSGSRTYKLRAASSGGTMTVQAASGIPAFILVEDIGPA